MLRILSFVLALFAALPAPARGAPALADPQGEPIVVGLIHQIKSSVYGDERVITVRLPRGYADDPARSYPVLFSVDGGPDQDFELLAGVAAERNSPRVSSRSSSSE
ncbi:MAG: hypothetical protein H0X53_09260 [Sphingomonas sp.]|nr:hypothetical protein [Sphingomonas sp.]